MQSVKLKPWIPHQIATSWLNFLKKLISEKKSAEGETNLKNLPSMHIRGLSGRVLDSRPRGCRFEPHRHHCVVSLSKNINPSLVLAQPRKTNPFITESLSMGRKESN